MYRAPAPSPRCPSCGAPALTEETKLDPSAGWLKVHFEIRDAKPSIWKSRSIETFIVSRARVCLECGHVVVGLSTHELERLRAKMPSLAPIPHEPPP